MSQIQAIRGMHDILPADSATWRYLESVLRETLTALEEARNLSDPLLVGEELRRARLGFDRLIGKATTEDMLDALFGRFCIGK